MRLYLAVPYSHKEEAVMVERCHCVNLVAGHLLLKGHVVFSPISMTHSISHHIKLPRDWKFWRHQDEPFLDWCEAMAILALKGWEDSVGVTDEIKIIQQQLKQIYFIDYNNLEKSINQIPV